MKWVEHVQTRDGVLHRTAQEARRHAERMYGERLSSIAHNLLRPELVKYDQMQRYIDENLVHFLELKKLKDDITLEKREEDE